MNPNMIPLKQAAIKYGIVELAIWRFIRQGELVPHIQRTAPIFQDETWIDEEELKKLLK